MEKSLDVAQLQPACEPSIDYATALNRAYAQTPELPANGAANDVSVASVQTSEECEPNTPRLTSVDELLSIAHWKPAEAQYCKAIADHYQVGKRSVQKWFVDLIKLVQDIAPGVAETDLRQADRYTLLAVELLGHRYFTGSSKKWAIVLAEEYRDRLQALPSAQTATLESPAIEPETTPEPEPEQSNAIVVPQSHIQLLDDHQQSELAAIHSLYVKPEPVKTFQSIELNGDQSTILEGLKLLHSTVFQMKAQNDRIKADTSQRKSDIELANEALAAITQAGKQAVDENFELVAQAQAVKAEETEAKKRLAQFLQSLGVL
ncbi:hypothetical protein H6F67_00380 [Microcoleus sp. FACHB-1515]|uniref:hypothetical protein n=1 Tax=Cyanophyceae TaxID=3028117 RepID=UPI0016843E14|nr:hypothetical protein [Microcoleus sp. FACHB-1515]MBD2088332.1 hypothetical protein [Microcoleus sp. FACHB-1515]